MDWFETLHLKSYRKADKDAALQSFRQLILSDPQDELGDIILLQDIALNNLCIVIRWQGEISNAKKSHLGRKLAAVFSVFGRIDHQIWRHEKIFSRTYDRQIRKHRLLP